MSDPAIEPSAVDPAPSDPPANNTPDSLLGGGDPAPPIEPSPSMGLVSDDGKFTEDWLDKLGAEDDARPTLSKYGSLNDLAKSHHHLQQLVGKKSSAVNPLSEESTPEEIASYRKAFGIPEDPAGYGVAAPENLPEGMQWNQELADGYVAKMHAHHAPPALVKELMEMKVQEDIQRQEQIDSAYNAQLEQETKALKAEWGDDFDKNVSLAKRGAATLGLDPNDPIFNNTQVVKAMARLPGLVSESKLVNGHQNADLMDNASRAIDIQTNPQNPYYNRYQEGDEAVVAMVRGYRKQN